jgi:hypothetical protein
VLDLSGGATTLRRIRDGAFVSSLRTPIHLNDGIEIIGIAAFATCSFTNFRIPPLITVIPKLMLSNCRAMFSLELSENMREIRNAALRYCHCLRNVALPPNTILGDDIFITEAELQTDLTDLQRLFGNSNARIIFALQHRFDRLPIHKLVYYTVSRSIVSSFFVGKNPCRCGKYPRFFFLMVAVVEFDGCITYRRKDHRLALLLVPYFCL